MNEGRMAVKRMVVSESERAGWVRKYKGSGLTQREFVRQHGLKLSTLQYWVVRERQAVTECQPPAPAALFAEVKLPAAATPSWAAELVQPGGSTLRIGRDLSPVLLEQLLRACRDAALPGRTC